jgi:hypothetical protein
MVIGSKQWEGRDELNLLLYIIAAKNNLIGL